MKAGLLEMTELLTVEVAVPRKRHESLATPRAAKPVTPEDIRLESNSGEARNVGMNVGTASR